MRTLKLYGINNAEYKVYINQELSESSNTDLIYSFSTETTLHDSYNIKIEVTKGSLILEKCLVDYPAILNGKKGKITFDQPIETPLYKFNGYELEAQPFPITINEGETVEFEQLMFNGPTLFDVELTDTTKVKESIYIGNLITKEFIPEMKNIVPIYDYEPQDHNIWSNVSLQYLVSKVSHRLSSQT